MKTQISLGIRPVWSESLLCAKWLSKDPSSLHADSETLIRLGGCQGWSESSLGGHAILLVLSCAGANDIRRYVPYLPYAFWQKDVNIQIVHSTTLNLGLWRFGGCKLRWLLVACYLCGLGLIAVEIFCKFCLGRQLCNGCVSSPLGSLL